MRRATKRRQMDRKIVERLLAGAGINELARELKVSKRRIVMARALAEEAGYFDDVKLPIYPEAVFAEKPDGRSERGSAVWRQLEEHLPWIRERIESGWHAITVFEELPIKVPRSNFYRFLIRHHLNEKKHSLRRVVPEIVHTAGEALLIDWGHLWSVERNGKREKLWAFVGILGYSRYMVVKVTTSLTQVSVLMALAALYDELGGVPQRTTSDNPKVFALIADRHEPLIHPIYERFAAHYGTRVECLPPKNPQKKGKVERPMPYIRRLLEAYPGDKNDVAAVQAYLTRKVALANERRHGTTNERPVDRFVEEKAALKKLPTLPYDIEHYHEGAVRVDGHIRFLGKYYSVDESFIHKDVTVIGNSRTVSIYHAGKLIETHERLTCRLRSKSTKLHHLKPWEQVCANPDGLRGEARKIGSSVEQLVTQILHTGDGFVDFRKIWGILSLAKKYSPLEVDTACEDALADGELSSKVVERYIIAAREERLVQAQPSPPPAPAGRFQRDLSEYAQLLLNLGKPKGDAYEH